MADQFDHRHIAHNENPVTDVQWLWVDGRPVVPVRAVTWAHSVKIERPSWFARMRALIFRSKGGA